MKTSSLILLILLFLVIVPNQLFSQNQVCGFDEFNKQELLNNPKAKLQKAVNEAEYQKYLNNYSSPKNKAARVNISDRSMSNSWGLCDANNRVLKIPVVVHIIHTGEALGVGYNRDDAWVNTLITNLNNKFRNLNNLPQTTDTKIEFYLAKRDPNGNATTGINRANGTAAFSNYATVGFPKNNEIAKNALRDLNRWPNDQYLNIWIVNFFESGVGGYGNYPGDETYNGAIFNGNYYTLAVHELGHVFNLAHTFEGDNENTICPSDIDCSIDGDGVCDTPPHKREDCFSGNCAIGNSTGTFDNVKYNFMAYYYANSVCNQQSDRFTPGQIVRLRAAALGKYRGKLLISEALIPVNNIIEAGIKQIKTSCFTTFSPEVTLKNYGTAPITSAILTCKIDGNLVQTYNYTGNIPSNTTSIITLNAINVSAAVHTIEISWIAVNGVANDTFQEDNTYCGRFSTEKFNVATDFPINEDFESQATLSSYWSVVGLSPVTILPSNTCVNRGTNILRVNNFAVDVLSTDTTTIELSKTIDLSNTAQSILTFNIAARRTYYCDYWKSLKVQVSSDCGTTWETVYHKNDKGCGGSEVATAEPLWTVPHIGANPTSGYVPNSCNEWRKETIDLNPFFNKNIKIRFLYYGYKGNPDNVYLDDINIMRIPSNRAVEASLSNITSSCNSVFRPAVNLKNYGTNAITAATLECRIDGSLVQTYSFVGNIASNATDNIILNPISVSKAVHSMEIKWININGVTSDYFTLDNVISTSFSTEILPEITNFETDGIPYYWTKTGFYKNDIEVANLNTCNARGINVLKIKSFNNIIRGTDTEKTTIIALEKSIDLTKTLTASLSFSIAARQTYYCDYWKSLKVQVSSDCGTTWETVYHKNDSGCSGPETTTALPLWTVPRIGANPTTEYIPTSCADWRTENIDLSAYRNQVLKVRFVHYGYKGNPDNLYLDDINITKTSNFCVQNPNTNPADTYDANTNHYPVGISTQTKIQANWPANVPNALLVLESKNKGFVITRITTAQRNALTPIQGMLIYNIDPAVNCIQLYNGTTWKCIEKNCNQ